VCVNNINRKKPSDLFIITIEDAQNVRYFIQSIDRFVHAVNVSHDQNLTHLKTEKDIIIAVYV